MDECASEGVPRAKSVDDVHIPGIDPHALVGGLGESPLGALLNDRQLDAPFEEGVGRSFGIGDADSHLAFLAITDGDVHAGQDGCDARTRLGHAAPQIGAVVEVEDRHAIGAVAVIEGAQVQAEGGVARQAGHGEPEDSSSLNGVPIHLILPQLQVRGAGLSIEVEGEGVRREKLGKGHRGVEVAHGDDMIGGDAEALQLSRHEAAEGVVPHAGDDAGAMPEAGSCDGDVRRAAAEELSEGLDIFEVGTNLERENVNTGTTHC